jgi:hypothetical protein
MRALSLAFVIFLASCGASESDDMAACKAVVAARCQRLAACSTADMTKRWTDEMTCEARQLIQCDASLAGKDTGATATSVNACATAIPTESCPQFLGVDPAEACLPATGTRAIGAACEYNGQCQSTFCATASTALCGTCAPVPAAGDSCANNGCGPTMSCVTATMTCQVPVAAQGSCSADLPCAVGYACVGANAQTGVMGTCTAEVETMGGTCDAKRATGPDCDPDAGLACNSTTNMCVAQPIVAAGQTCGNVNGVGTRCLAGATCVRATGAATGTCIAPAADGAACDTVAGPGCLYPAKCVVASSGGTAGTCELPGDPSCD